MPKIIGIALLALALALPAVAQAQDPGAPVKYDPEKPLFDTPESYEYSPSQRHGNVHPDLEEYKPLTNPPNGVPHPEYGVQYGPGQAQAVEHPYYTFERIRSPEGASRIGNRITPHELSVSLVSGPADPARQIAIRLAIPKSMESCIIYGPLEYTKSISDGIYLDIEVLGFQPLDTAENCNRTAPAPSAEIPVGIDELQGIRQIRFRSLYTIDYYNVYLDKNHVEIRPKGDVSLFRPLTDSRLHDPLERWLYPGNLVILSVPAAPAEQSCAPEVDALARGMGMTPLAQLYPGFVPQNQGANTYYYVDNAKRFAANLQPDAPQQAGSITLMRRYASAAGPVARPESLDVYVRRPGNYE